MSSVSLEGKVAIVTGASRPNGMGYATAKVLAARGATVVITDLPESNAKYERGGGLGSSESLEQAVATLKADGAKVMGLGVDVTQLETIQACVAKTTEEFGGVDILVNNAGVFVGAGPLFKLSRQDWDISWQVHVTGAMEFIKEVVPSMRERGGGSVINNASLFGVGAFPGCSAYVASKFGMVGMTKALAIELGPENIRVNAVCPGNITTDVSHREFESIAKRLGVTPEEVEKAQGEEAALKRRGKPQEVAETVAFLASPASGFVTGVAIPVDGAQQRGV